MLFVLAFAPLPAFDELELGAELVVTSGSTLELVITGEPDDVLVLVKSVLGVDVLAAAAVAGTLMHG